MQRQQNLQSNNRDINNLFITMKKISSSSSFSSSSSSSSSLQLRRRLRNVTSTLSSSSSDDDDIVIASSSSDDGTSASSRSSSATSLESFTSNNDVDVLVDLEKNSATATDNYNSNSNSDTSGSINNNMYSAKYTNNNNNIDMYDTKKKKKKPSVLSLPSWFRSKIFVEKKSTTSSVTMSTITIADPVQYSTKRQMTVAQERGNALSILPALCYCLYFIITTSYWIPADILNQVAQFTATTDNNQDDVHCLSSSSSSSSWFWLVLRWFIPSSLVALPPPTVLAITIGTIVHAPGSFLYHWKYCTDPSVPNKIDHWSRRLDQSLIHFTGAVWSYGTSNGSALYFFVNLIFCGDCIRCIIQPVIKPRRNQIRILLCVVLYTIPLLVTVNVNNNNNNNNTNNNFNNSTSTNDNDEEEWWKILSWNDDDNGGVTTFVQFWKVFLLGIFFFVAYPVGGWSHTMFHIVTIPLPVILMHHAIAVASLADNDTNYHDWIMHAAQCVVMSTPSSST